MKLLARSLWLPRIAAAHFFFYVATGVWPLVHMPSFVAVTGAESKPERAWWLVQTVAVLICVIGSVIGFAAWRRRFTIETVLLAVGGAAGLAAVDLILVPKGIIAPIYLWDAAAEIGLIALWLWAWRRERDEFGA